MPSIEFSPNYLAPEGAATRSIAELAAYPAVSGEVLCRHARLLGCAGEMFADSQFMQFGIHLLPMPEGLPSDRLFLLPGTVLSGQIKIQSRQKGDAFVFNLQKGYRGSPAGCRDYEEHDFDLAVLVILPLGALKVVHRPGNRVRVPVAEIPDLRANPMASFWEAVRAHAASRNS